MARTPVTANTCRERRPRIDRPPWFELSGPTATLAFLASFQELSELPIACNERDRRSSHPPNRHPLRHLPPPKAPRGVVVDDADRLHPSVDDRRADELEAAPLQLLRDARGQLRLARKSAPVPPQHLAAG